MSLNAVAVKKALIAAVKASADDRLAGVQVEYMLGRDIGREVVYGGRIDSTVDRATMSATSDREERATISLHIRVMQEGGAGSEPEERAAEIAGGIADLVAADPTLGGAAFDVTLVNESYECGPLDDAEAGALATLQFLADSFLDGA